MNLPPNSQILYCACSVDNTYKGVLATRVNPDTCGRENSIRTDTSTVGDVQNFKSASNSRTYKDRNNSTKESIL